MINDGSRVSRCGIVLEDGGAGIPGTLGIIEVYRSADRKP